MHPYKNVRYILPIIVGFSIIVRYISHQLEQHTDTIVGFKYLKPSW